MSIFRGRTRRDIHGARFTGHQFDTPHVAAVIYSTFSITRDPSTPLSPPTTDNPFQFQENETVLMASIVFLFYNLQGGNTSARFACRLGLRPRLPSSHPHDTTSITVAAPRAWY